MKKTLLLSLSLSFLLHAEDDGFYMSAGYQIGEAAQMVTNTKGIQQLSDNYENLSKLLTRYSTLNTLIQLSADPSAIDSARENLGASSRNLLDVKTNSPAYQAVLLALNAAVGLWQVTSFAISACGPGPDESKNGGIQSFSNTPGANYLPNDGKGVTITCNSYFSPGKDSGISTEDYAKINQAFQIIQKALTANGSNGDGVPVLSNTTTKLEFIISGDKRTGGKKGTIYEGKPYAGCLTYPWSNGKCIYTQWINTENTEQTETKIDTTNNAQVLLEQASTIITTYNKACPYLTNGAAGYWNGINGGNGTVCGTLANEISAIQKMITDAQEAVAQAKIVSENTQNQSNLDTGKPFNPFTDASFANGMLANAQAQAEILNQAEQVVKNFEKIPTTFVNNFLGVCDKMGFKSGQVSGYGCANVEETITNLKNSIAHFGTQAQQIQQAENIADTLVNFKSKYSELGNTYNSITTALSNIPNAQSLQNAVSKKNNPYSPQGIETNYYLNQNTYNQIQTINQELGRNPFRKVGIVSSQTNNGAMNGIGIQVGYKQFFGQKRRWGARYYGFFDYNHAFIKSSFFNSASDVWTYGFGADALYNFINDKATNFLGKNNKLSVGLFGGIALAGTSWLNSEYVNLATVNNVYNAKMNVANFQFLFNMGVRMNLARSKKKGSDHAAQHGIELGLKIPTINTNYYSFMGAELKYRRLYSVYLNYVFAY
ncbi:outer membrane beta-barrel protein [Helicobacter pylori]|nr:outer membrane beta-barrel protein [Helicobacter pylori]WQS97189.1 outer membrane beta-barrel protein [Helicobacter pylori]